MNDKLSKLHRLFQRVKKCDLCCTIGNGIEKRERLLRNLIAEAPVRPRYGDIPTMYTDWASRVHAKIAIVMQDWGSARDALKLSKHYKKKAKEECLSLDDAWRSIVQKRPKPSPTHRNIIRYLIKSAEREGLKLPSGFLDDLYFTNAVLCFRRGGASGSRNIDLETSIRNCCDGQKFLYGQLAIVRPLIVVAAGRWALKGLGFNEGVGPTIRSVREESAYGYKEISCDGLSLCVVPTFHPAAVRNRSRKQQISDYQFVWKGLEHILGRDGKDLVKTCFVKGSSRQQ